MEQKYHFFLTLPSPRSKTQRLPALFHPLHSVFRCPCGRGRRASLSFGWRFSAFGLCFPREGRRGGTDRLPPRLRAECRPHLWMGSRHFPLLCSFRPFARGRSSLREETFVSSRRDVCLFPKGRNLSTTGAPPESTSAEKGRRGRTCPRRPFSGGAFVNLSRSEVQILPRMRSMTQLVGVALTELQAQMERPRRWSTMSRRSGRCLCFGLSTRRVSSPSSVCRWMGA